MCFADILQLSRPPSFFTHTTHTFIACIRNRSFKPIVWHAPAPHVPFIRRRPAKQIRCCSFLTRGPASGYEVTNGRLADLPLQRLSRTHQGWQMARDGFWSLPPGDVSAGCQTDTPDTWTASAGGAALVPAPRYHGHPPCNETPVHLVNWFIRGGRWGGKIEGGLKKCNRCDCTAILRKALRGTQCDASAAVIIIVHYTEQ